MVAVTPIASVVERLEQLSEDDVGRLASGGFGPTRRKQFLSDLRHVVSLAKKFEAASAAGLLR